MRTIFFCLIVAFAATSVSGDPLHETSTQELQLMLNNIEGELTSRGVSLEEKRARIKAAESRMKKLVSRGSVRNAIVGSVLAAAVTAHPAGILVGGVAGGLVGKSKRYAKAEERLAVIEQDIIVDEDDFLTEGEVRLASFSGDSDELPLDQVEEQIAKKYGLLQSGDEQQMLAGEADANKTLATVDSSQTAVEQTNGYQQVTVAEASGVAAPIQKYSGVSQTSGNKPAQLDSCYSGREDDRASRTSRPHCFYMMY